MRAFQLAKDALMRKDYAEALFRAENGLEYDRGISDLWYVAAVALKHMDALLDEVYARVSTALGTDNWIDYNKDGARILAADILSDTLKCAEALEVLASPALIYSNDAEFIRAKCYYRLSRSPHAEDTADFNRLRARETVTLAHKIYPRDDRYLRLFFQNELLYGYETTAQLRALANLYVREVMLSDGGDAELFMLAAAFAEGEDRIRMLRSFQGRGMRHPLYALFALEDGLLSQQAAFDYFAAFASESVPRELFETFALFIDDETVIQAFAGFLSAYSGVITSDTTGDRIVNLTTRYESGRPKRIEFDENQNGQPDWIVQCDYGVPVEVFMPAENLRVFFGAYPSVTRAELRGVDFLLPETHVSWSPVTMQHSARLLESPGAYSFFVPEQKKGFEAITERALYAGAAIITSPVPDSETESIAFTMSNGKPLSSEHFKDGRLYARTFFTNGIPATRSVDEDADGIFEITQVFGFDPRNYGDFQTEAEEKKLYDSLFGVIESAKGTYLLKISLDTNADTVADFVEEYTGGGGKSAWWDTDGDGNWDIAVIRHPNSGVEDSLFRMFNSEYPVIVRSENGVPVSVSRNNRAVEMSKDPRYDFYWLGVHGDREAARLLEETLDKNAAHSVAVIEGELQRIIAVKIGNLRFGEVLHE